MPGRFGKGMLFNGRMRAIANMKSRKTIKETILGITKPAIRRLARRAGVMRLSALIYDETRFVIEQYLRLLIHDTILYMEHFKRVTVIPNDVIYALKRQGRTLYGYGY
ncbi:hypothetical protein FGO68_gene9881 [Halteria grandinella]|uniref:Histone H4 n=1 Tax=Halteria grandinella TaxID=5974 RepID=A0A8J8SY49_HALGN|nr:hypothetical protein FGO68_gene9881 [Halteria grandinella]